jgi:hypothetical protein
VIWDLATITRVKGSWTALDVHGEVLSVDGVREAARYRLARAFIHEAHALGVDVDVDDVVYNEAPREMERGGEVTIRACWRPRTNEIEFVGGGVDGRIMAIRRPGEPYLVPRRPSLGSFTDPAELVTPTLIVDRYELAGWHETERRWIYKFSR